MFDQVEEYPVDPIMIGADYFAADPRVDKLNLTVGIYQDEHGATPVLEAVKIAEQRLVDTQTSKSYLALTGDADYCRVLGQETMGNVHDEGCALLRLDSARDHLCPASIDGDQLSDRK